MILSGEELPETFENEPMNPDLEDFDIDPFYRKALYTHAREYAAAGYDAEDARVSQLRQLVAAAEDWSLTGGL